MTKTIWLGLVALAFVTGSVLTGTAYAKENPNGQPFQALWDAIADLQDQIDNIGDGGSDLSDLNTYRVRSALVLVEPNTAETANASCNLGDLITGGGFVTDNANNRASVLLGSQQVGSTWTVTMRHDGSTTGAFGFVADVQCLDITP